jgi:kynureninase
VTDPRDPPDPLVPDPGQFAHHYRRFAVADRLLLTGHSHQAWPDVAREGQLEAFDDAARDVDGKWEAAAAKADRVQAGYAQLIGDAGAEIALGQNTHELLLRFLSAIGLPDRPRLITTDGEFHTIRRQLDRLAEAGLDVERVAARPAETLAERLASAVATGTTGAGGDRGPPAAVLVSAVLFEDARIVPGLDELAAACAVTETELLIDAYHALGPVPFTAPATAWVVGGGYKYLQLGEGNCFLRVPAHAAHARPVITGWYAEFAALGHAHRPGEVVYGTGAAAFAGSTYDPASHYRAARVLDFFAEQGLTAPALRASYQRQLAVLAQAVDELALPAGVLERDRTTPLDRFGGFLALRSDRAAELQRGLAQRGVHTDARGCTLRLGPAPYLTDAQLRSAVAILGDVARGS